MLVKIYGKVTQYQGTVQSNTEVIYNTSMPDVLSNYLSTKNMKRTRAMCATLENKVRITYAAFARHFNFGIGSKELHYISLLNSNKTPNYKLLSNALKFKNNVYLLKENHLLFEWICHLVQHNNMDTGFASEVQNITFYPEFTKLYRNLNVFGCEGCDDKTNSDFSYGINLCKICRVGRGFKYQETSYFSQMQQKCQCGREAVVAFKLPRVMCEKCYFEYRLNLYKQNKENHNVDTTKCKGCGKDTKKESLAPGSDFCEVCYEEIYADDSTKGNEGGICNGCHRGFSQDELVITNNGILCTECINWYGGKNTGWI